MTRNKYGVGDRSSDMKQWPCSNRFVFCYDLFIRLKVQDRKFWEQLESERIQEAVAEREVAVQHRVRLARMKADKDMFLEKLKTERKTVYQVRLASCRLGCECHNFIFSVRFMMLQFQYLHDSL